MDLCSHISIIVFPMTDHINKMVQAVRREVIAWVLAGAALHLIIKHGVSRWNLAALGMSLGIGASAKAKRRHRAAPPTDPDMTE